MSVQFGVFDHLDKKDVPIHELYEERLQLIERYDKAGFYAYHLAEHHGSPLGMAPSPSVFLASVAQRTTRLRFGPLVFTLPLYEPLRLVNEICMLDHLSNGRLELGVGRGISAFEIAFYGVSHLEARRMYDEALQVLLKGLTSEVLDHQGEYYRYFNVPMELRPLQEPHPPLWYGMGSAPGIDWSAKNRVHVVSNAPSGAAKGMIARYREQWDSAHGTPIDRMMGVARHIYVAETEAEAEKVAERAQQKWYESFAKVWRDYGANPLRYPADFAGFRKMGLILCGTPDQVREAVARDVAESGCNYFVCRFAYGDLTLKEASRSLALFADEVMPQFGDTASAGRAAE